MTNTLPVTLLLVRHGRTAWNAERRVLGRTDIGLDDVGLAQAAALPANIGTVDAVWTSPMRRARETAQALGHPLREEPGLMEMDQGAMEGLAFPEMMARFGDIVTEWRANPSGRRLPEGEMMEEVQERALAALRRIAAECPPGARVAVVTHQLVLAAVCVALSGRPMSAWTEFTHDNCGWTVVEVHDDLRLVAVKQGGTPG